MTGKSVGAAQFKADCLRLIEEMNADGEPVTVTRRGLPVAELRPIVHGRGKPSIVGAMRGTVLRYDDPFAPAVDPSEWDAAR